MGRYWYDPLPISYTFFQLERLIYDPAQQKAMGMSVGTFYFSFSFNSVCLFIMYKHSVCLFILYNKHSVSLFIGHKHSTSSGGHTAASVCARRRVYSSHPNILEREC